MFDSMASHRKNSQVHQESAPRAPVVPQHATGMRNNNENEQRQIGLTSGAQFGVQARTAGTDPGGTSQPGQNLKLLSQSLYSAIFKQIVKIFALKT
jgi:hypothetical protein